MTSSGNEGTSASQDAELPAGGEEQELRQEIEDTRQQLGETVEALAAKADVKARAGAGAAVLAGRVKAAAPGVGAAVAARAASAREAAPRHLQQAVARSAGTARQQPAPLAAAAAALVLGYLAVRLWRSAR
jgi:Protein of unknown function (DUF3618)